MAATTTMSCVEKRLLVVVCFLGVLCLVPSVSAKWVKSSIDTLQDWKFLTSFCFLPKYGRLNYTIKYPVSYGVQQLLLYYDTKWENVSKSSSKNCTERMSVLSKVNNQIIDLTNRLTDSRNAGCSVDKQDGVDYYNCMDHIVFHSASAGRWYIVLARCAPSDGGRVGLKLDYSIHMVNDVPHAEQLESVDYGVCSGHKATPEGWLITAAVIALHHVTIGKYL